MNQIKTMIYEAEKKMNLWKQAIDDPTALKEVDKTREDAIALANYFEGKYDAYLNMVKSCQCK